ncbi:MAG: EamA family transporter [Candidatus Lokiarchaeota archaeon]|nr:EamA family transporter [Candidatus Lokiarchaeota archaeon]MCK4281421.1 EamA family transporter [Candidatus Lokiarchaeota archaeon]
MAGNIFLGILFGLFNTIQLHLAKGMERYGIDIFSRDKSLKEKGKKPLIYVIGIILNYTLFIYQILGNAFSTATVFSSVFGIGVIILMIFSKYILKEKIKKIEYIGAVLIIIGTIVVGYTLFELEIYYQDIGLNQSNINWVNFIIVMIIFSGIFIVFLFISAKTTIAVSLIFGLVAGACGGIDNTLKHLGMIEGFTLHIFLNPIFLLSFLSGFFAFLITQWGFAKKAKASKLVPSYNSLYILLPVFLELLIIEGTMITPLQLISTFVIIIGVILMNIFKEKPEIADINKD